MPAKLIIADSETSADLLWATRFFVPDPVIFIEKNRRKYLIVSDLEYSRAKKETTSCRVSSFKEFSRSPSIAEIARAALKRFKIKGVTVPANFSLKTADDLRKKGVRVSVCKGPLFPERGIKSAGEIREIKRSLAATGQSIKSALEAIRLSKIRNGKLYLHGKLLTSEQLKRIINIHLMGHGYIARRTIVSCGSETSDPHCEGAGPLYANSPIVIDVFPRSEKSGYHGDVTRTVVKGHASKRIRAMHRAVRLAQEAAFKKIRHGERPANVHKAVIEVFKERGFRTKRINGALQGFIHSTGHGVGLEVHESPRIGPVSARARHSTAAVRLKRTKEAASPLLKAGNVVTVEPGLYYPDAGGVRIEDVVLVTKKGCRVLTRLSKGLEI